MLSLHVLPCILALYLVGRYTDHPYILLLTVVKGGAVFHEDSPHDVRAVESDEYIVLVVERHVGKDGKHGTNHARVVLAPGLLELVQNDVYEV